jgi:hypothetical protein
MGTIDFEPDNARLAKIIITPANTDHTNAHVPASFFRHRRRAAIPFMIAMKA